MVDNLTLIHLLLITDHNILLHEFCCFLLFLTFSALRLSLFLTCLFSSLAFVLIPFLLHMELKAERNDRLPFVKEKKNKQSACMMSTSTQQCFIRVLLAYFDLENQFHADHVHLQEMPSDLWLMSNEVMRFCWEMGALAIMPVII